MRSSPHINRFHTRLMNAAPDDPNVFAVLQRSPFL
jgi:hypothetical protein